MLPFVPCVHYLFYSLLLIHPTLHTTHSTPNRRKEMEEKVEKGEAVTLAPSDSVVGGSGCGNCSKGDAFRCAGCPFLGKPAFSEDDSGAVQLVL